MYQIPLTNSPSQAFSINIDDKLCELEVYYNTRQAIWLFNVVCEEFSYYGIGLLSGVNLMQQYPNTFDHLYLVNLSDSTDNPLSDNLSESFALVVLTQEEVDAIQEDISTAIVSYVLSPVNTPVYSMQLDFNTTPSKGPRFSFARSTIGTYIDNGGVLQEAAINIPRFEAHGYLCEGVTTNLLPAPNNFAVSWATTNCAIEAYSAYGPDAAENTASVLRADATPASGHYMTESINPLVDATLYTFSIFAKRYEGDVLLRLSLTNTAFAPGHYAVFDLADGSLYDDSGTLARYKIVPMAEGWYRISITAATVAAAVGDFNVKLTDASGNTSFDGDGISGFEIAYSQVEALPWMTSYIETTRGIDKLYYDYPGDFCPAYDEEVLYIFTFRPYGIFPFLALPSVAQCMLERDGRAGLLQWQNMQFLYDGTIRSIKTAPTLTIGTATDEEEVRIGCYFNPTTQKVYKSGVLTNQATASYYNYVDTADVITIGCNSSYTENFYGHIKDFKIYDVELTEDEMMQEYEQTI